jgi:hypothetical protein
MSDGSQIAQWRVADLVAHIGSEDVSPGAGAAGAVAVALAAACASKAVSVSLKHHTDDADLRQALESLATIGRYALSNADVDSAAFEEYLHAKDSVTAGRLIRAGRKLGHLIAALNSIVTDIEPGILQSVAGDLAAARALADAARIIETRNEAETANANS